MEFLNFIIDENEDEEDKEEEEEEQSTVKIGTSKAKFDINQVKV